MLLLTPSEAARLIGAKCGGNSPSDSDSALVDIMRVMTPRVLAACDVQSLALALHRDRFRVRAPYPARGGSRLTLRLTNAFLTPDDTDPEGCRLTLTDPDGESVDLADPAIAHVNRLTGMIDLYEWTTGTYTVDYRSGFAYRDGQDEVAEEEKVVEGIPEWMRGVVAAYLVVWYRAVQKATGKLEGIAYGALMDALGKEIAARVYGSFQRPRLCCQWADTVF